MVKQAFKLALFLWVALLISPSLFQASDAGLVKVVKVKVVQKPQVKKLLNVSKSNRDKEDFINSNFEILPLIDINMVSIPNPKEYEVLELPNTKAVTLEPLKIDDAKTVYRYIHWEEAQKVLPNYMEYKVTDVVTGKFWNMRRLGGVNHADSVSRTPEDTAIMLEVFGEWDWDARSVVIDTVSGFRMPAAIRGMPHGIWSNWNFNEMLGHVCLYFTGSTTHYDNTAVESADKGIVQAEEYLILTYLEA